MSKFKKIIICIISLLIIIPLGVYGYVRYKLNDIIIDSNYQSKIEEVSGITNILLLGTDGRKDETAFRTDSMIILTVDNNNKNIKLTSLARDTYVDIPGKGKGKLNLLVNLDNIIFIKNIQNCCNRNIIYSQKA